MKNADFDQFDFKAPWMPQELYDIVPEFRGGMLSRQPPEAPPRNESRGSPFVSFLLFICSP